MRILMKTILLVSMISYFGCSSSLEMEKSITVSEKLIEAMKLESYEDLDKLYTADFFSSNSITKEQWIEDLQMLKEKLGVIESYEFTNSNNQANIGSPDMIVIGYLIKHSKFSSRQTFTIVTDDNGGHRIIGHNVASDAL